MMASRTFGRRVSAGAPLRTDPPPPGPVPALPVDEQQKAVDEPVQTAPALDEELRAWQRERLKSLPGRLPLRQLSLMASLSFGVASFVLPDSINDGAGWLLYILTAASTVTWLATWMRKNKVIA